MAEETKETKETKETISISTPKPTPESYDTQLFKRYCPRCKQEIKNFKPGFGNWKNLFKTPSLDDWITLFIIIMILFSMWAYKHDTAVCVNFVKNVDAICMAYKTNITYLAKPEPNYSAILNFTYPS